MRPSPASPAWLPAAPSPHFTHIPQALYRLRVFVCTLLLTATPFPFWSIWRAPSHYPFKPSLCHLLQEASVESEFIIWFPFTAYIDVNDYLFHKLFITQHYFCAWSRIGTQQLGIKSNLMCKLLKSRRSHLLNTCRASAMFQVKH